MTKLSSKIFKKHKNDLSIELKAIFFHGKYTLLMRIIFSLYFISFSWILKHETSVVHDLPILTNISRKYLLNDQNALLIGRRAPFKAILIFD